MCFSHLSPIPVQTRSLSEPLRLAHAGAPPRRLPPLERDAGAELGPAQRRAVVLAIVVLHLLAAWGLLQVQAVRDTALQVAPILVDLLAPPAPPTPPAPPRPPVAKIPPTPPKPLPRPQPPMQAPVLTTPAVATPESYTVAPPDPAPPPPVPTAAPAAAAEPAPAAPAPPAKLLPDAAVQYLEPPQVEYPRASLRRGETGLVVVRAYVGTGGGAPHSVQVERSSGHARLDQAALAAVQKARFKPYAEAGRPVEGWALIPIRFELEK